MTERPKIGAYFYPNEPSDPIRKLRAGGRSIPSEFALAENAKPLFPGHDQPKRYCLGDKDITDWNDSDEKTTRMHLELAHEAGIDYFTIDTYLGIRGGMKIQESAGFLKNISKLRSGEMGNLSFAIMCCLRAPRALLPVFPGQEEKNRAFEVSQDTAQYIIDTAVSNYWNHSNYLTIHGRPYLSVFTPGEHAFTHKAFQFTVFMQELKYYAWEKYGIEPYLAGIVSHSDPVRDAEVLKKFGVDAIAGYANLIRFSGQSPVVMDYTSLIQDRMAEWKAISHQVSLPVIPSAVSGLDASPRCIYTRENGKPYEPSNVNELARFAGIYPHTPIVTNSSPEAFSGMLMEAMKVVTGEVTDNPVKMVNILGWNEASEGGCVLPRIRDNEIDWSYINVIKSVTFSG